LKICRLKVSLDFTQGKPFDVAQDRPFGCRMLKVGMLKIESFLRLRSGWAKESQP
jgi:hypothetical protein